MIDTPVKKIAKTSTAPAVMPKMPVPASSEDGLRRYLHDISKIPMLEHKDEIALSKKWRDEGDVAAAHTLVTSHLRLVAKIAFKFKGYGLPMGDLIAEGNIGMMQAVKRFDPDKGFRLSTYAIWWIKAAIQEYILRSWSMVKIGSSAAQKRLFFNLRRLKQKIGQQEGISERGMSDAQVGKIADILDVNAKDVVEMDQRMSGQDVFLNSAAYQEGEGEKIDMLPSEDANQETELANREERQNKRALLQDAMKTLNDRERDIIMRRRLQDKADTLEDLSKDYNISRERVRQIEVRALEKLQKQMVSADEAA